MAHAKIEAPSPEIHQADWARSVRRVRPPVTLEEYLQSWETFFDHYAAIVLQWRERNAGYHSTIASLARFYIPPGARVLEIGSGTGGLLYDIRLVFERLRSVCHPQTRIVIHWYNRAWEPVLSLAEKLGAKYPQPLLNWTTFEDIAN